MPISFFRRSRKAIVITAVLAVLATASFLHWRGGSQPPTKYLTAKARRSDIEKTVLATGVLQAVKQVDVGAQVSGQLKSLKVVLGQQVKKGELLAEIDPTVSRNDLDSAQASLDGIQLQKAGKKIQLQRLELAWKRTQETFAQDASSRQEMEAADADLRVARAELEGFDAQIRQQQGVIAKQQAQLSYTRIIAPMDGQVVSITTLEGQTVVASYQVPTLMKLADLSTITVKAQVSEADVVRVKPGQPVHFSILGDPDKRYSGTLRTVQPTPEKINNAMFFNAMFDVPNPDGVLRADMTAQVDIVLGEVKQAVVVPLAALAPVGKDGKRTLRVLKADGAAQQRDVRVGLMSSTEAEILDGLKEGEDVITGDDSGAPKFEGGF